MTIYNLRCLSEAHNQPELCKTIGHVSLACSVCPDFWHCGQCGLATKEWENKPTEQSAEKK